MILLLLLFVALGGRAMAEELVILYSANTNGYVEPCG